MSRFLSFPRADDGTHDDHAQEPEPFIDGIEAQGTDFEDVLRGDGGEYEANPEHSRDLHAAQRRLRA